MGFLVGEHKRRRYRGSNLGINYDSANNTHNKGVSWYKRSFKTDKIPEKYIWRSSSLVNQQAESLQKLTLFKLLKLKERIYVTVSGFTLCNWNKEKTKPKLRKNFQIWSLYLRTPITVTYVTKSKIIRHIYWSN